MATTVRAARTRAAALLGAVSRLVRTSRSISHRRTPVPRAQRHAVRRLKTLSGCDDPPRGPRRRPVGQPLGDLARAGALEQHGMVERPPEAGDARAWVLTLSAQGGRRSKPTSRSTCACSPRPLPTGISTTSARPPRH